MLRCQWLATFKGPSQVCLFRLVFGDWVSYLEVRDGGGFTWLHFSPDKVEELVEELRRKGYSEEWNRECYMLGVAVSPFSSISFIAEYFRLMLTLEKVSFFGVEPVLGQNSFLPMLWKKEGFPCIFMLIDRQPKCRIWEDAPISCITYPAGLYMKAEDKIKVVLNPNVLCPETAFLEGEPLEKLAKRAEEKFQKQAEFTELYLQRITPIMPEYLKRQEKIVRQLAAEKNTQLTEDEIPHIIQKAVALELLAIAVKLHADGNLTPKNLVDEYEKCLKKRMVD